MATLRILVPDGTTNYVKNPSARFDTTGWTAFGSTVTRTLDFARFGVSSLKTVTNGSALYEGLYYRVNALSGVSEPITVSVYVRGTGRVRIRLIDNPVGMEWASQSVTLRTDRWTRLSATGFSTGSNDMRLYVETTAVKAVTFYVDGAQMERKSYPTTYCLDPRTIVNTRYGTKRLCDVVLGDELLNERGEYNRIERHWPVKTDAYRITLENGNSIIASGDHRFSVTLHATGFSSDWSWKFRKTESLKIGDYIQLYAQPSVPENPVSMKSVSFAYLLGYLLGDGYFCSNTARNQPLISWTFGRDEMEMAKIVERKYQEVFSFQRGHSFPTAKRSSPTEIVLATQDRLVAELFRNADFPVDHPASKKYIPDSVYSYTKQELMAFLAGLIDSDGCVDMRGNMHIDSSSKDLIEQLHYIFYTKLGVHGWLGEYKDNSNFTGKERVSYRISFKMADVKFLGENGLVLHHPKKNSRMNLAGGNKRRRSAKISSIEKLGKRELIDITLSPGHTFIANGMVTHNCDGDQEGCRWNVIAHNSHSIRDAYSRAGGRWVELIGDDRQEKDLYMSVAGGLGLPPITNNTQSFADAPGSYYQNTKVMARVLTLTFHTKREDKAVHCKPDSLDRLHELRQMLIDLIKSDRTAGGEEFTLAYQDGEYPVYIKARYDGGLESEWDVRNSWTNSFPLRLLAVEPFWYEDEQNVADLDFQEWPDANFIMARVDGEWSILNYGFNIGVNDMALGARGEIVAGGNFTRANSDTNALDPLIPANRIAWWDGDKWNQYGVGANNVIWGVTVAPNGYVYATGAFTSIGGVAANRVAYWDGSAWNAMGSGLGGVGQVIAVAPDGDVYVGGGFTTAGGIPAYYIARWDGSSWHYVGNLGGLNNQVYALAISQDGTALYAGGAFTDEQGNPGSGLTRVAKYDLTTGVWEAMGGGFNSTVRALKLSPAGVLYAGGDFTASGSETINCVAYWNGSTWLPMSSGMSGFITGVSTQVYDLAVRASGELIAVGNFTSAGGVSAGGAAVWNGSTWTNLDISLTQYISAVVYDPKGNLYLAADSPVHVGGKTLVTNSGTSETSPVVYALGPATLKFIENYTSQKRVYLDLDILSGEEIFIDFGRGRVESTVRGDLSYTVKPGSDMRAFSLLPGENKIIAFMINDTGAKLQMSYTPKHWSADSTARGEGL